MYRHALLQLLGSARNPLAYTNKIKALGPIAYYPQAEPSGTTIVDESGNGRNGTYVGVTLGQPGIGDGRTAAGYDGATSYGNIYSASLAGAWNGAEGSIVIWGQWTENVDGANRFLANLFTNTNNRLVIDRTAATTLRWRYIAGGTTKTINITINDTNWHAIAVTWNKAADRAIGYYDGGQSGTTQTGLGTWVGALTTALIGASTITPTFVWKGRSAHVALFNRALSAAEIASLAVVP